ncbi:MULTISPECIES: bifunctional serine/threonine-protein kinase/ABC transporter substrate-binding protein [unclassified Microcoleus]|uniref:bifunctional serine/threonine-protein kinase/ABC transporter substrate-binding protein n=1 Tax=unclassified Microcoleus TaxID=2642155 RepID=UPI001E11F20A|nr:MULTISPECIES: bifunctional serine/threonine-protein kinase/ABC transporter substrate-binding protein [unclassified Microcoleus]MCC3568633.1 ABC transporter substrate-binding protein [Microcoleus sp. PH2017_31_RDM_U_A]MCC3580999.1 ABC transporter substrate-binding protein [Microcoleus sp. PH2017_32_RDM_D_A]MCC3619046.1 ABC transporter substrate-binding protein [Microcoleus sp. PH2017_38_RDM_U_B]
MCLKSGHILHENYKIIKELGRGGFAITYRANDLAKPGNPECVVKEIPFPSSNDPRVLQKARMRFEKEASALYRLGNHPCIPELFAFFEENDHFYLVQEYIEGHQLKEELTPGTQWEEDRAIALLLEILEILKFVHKQNIIHRDITPSNLIRRTTDNKIVLIDFGAVKEISTLTADSTGRIFTSQAIGTSGYMSPEQSNGRTAHAGNDIYSVGMIVIQVLTGKHPTELKNYDGAGEIIWHDSTSDRTPLPVSDNLKNILDRMVRFHYRINRYQSVTEVLRDLNAMRSPLLLEPAPNLGASDSDEVSPNQDSPPSKEPESGQTPPQGRSRFRWLLLGVAVIAAGAIVISIPKIYPLIPRISQPQTLPTPSPDGVSSGEKLLVQTSALWSKQRGINEFAEANYSEALKLLKQSWREDRRDPETLIYMNNALLKAINAEYYTIAIVVPIRRNQDGSIVNADLAEELLRGLAQAQTEVNLGLLVANNSNKDFPGQGFLEPKAIRKKGLRIIIADDGNIKSYAKQRANYLVTQPDILAVIGHYTSDMTVETVDIYNQNKLIAISPGSTTEELTRKPRKFFFRTAPTTSKEAEGLVNQLIKVGAKKVAVFYNPNSPFSASLWEEFKKQFEAQGGSTFRTSNYDLSKNDFNAEAAIKEVEKAGITALAVFPDGQVTKAGENAIEMIKINNNRNWMVGPWTLYDPRTLKAVKQLKSVEKLAVSVFWHPLISFDKKFPVNAEKLWGGPVNTRSALTYDAAKTLIKSLELQPEPSREGMQKTLASPDFKADGATGIIEFDLTTGNRKNPPKALAHVVPCAREQFGVTFVPIEFPTAAAAGLKCD